MSYFTQLLKRAIRTFWVISSGHLTQVAATENHSFLNRLSYFHRRDNLTNRGRGESRVVG